ncbi:kinase-like protein [Lichtheimia hyalospora FSU 10163]|nr:kinase-like protein [Lichtheimia hyalospora FSU 10163]
MRVVAPGEMQSMSTSVSSPLRCELSVSPIPTGQKRAATDDNIDSQEGNALDTPLVKKIRNLDPPTLLQQTLTSNDSFRSVLTETSNLFDQPDVDTQVPRDNTPQQTQENNNDTTIQEVDPIDHSLGWPCEGTSFMDDQDDDEDELDLASFVSARRSLFNELQSSEINHPEDDDDAYEESRRDLYEAILGEEEEEEVIDTRNGLDEGSSWLQEPVHSCGPQHYDDDIDDFFSSSHVEDCIATERIPSPQLFKRLRNWQKIRPGYLSSKPRFLTNDYFETNGPKSCDMDEEMPEDNEQEHPMCKESYLDTNFVLMDRLGSGEFADVYKARRHESSTLLAIKRTKHPFAGYDDRWQQIIEANHMNAVKGNRHCVELLSAWEENGYLFMEMELCRRGSLHQFINACDQVSEPMTWAIIGEIGEGLKAIHDADIIHLDLKPSNILIDATGRIKIGDFGLSVREPVDSRWIKGEGDRRYMAPELLRDIFHKPADIFSLGLIMLELSTQVELPDTGELWEQSRLGDFSCWSQDLSKTSNDIQVFIRWLLTADWQKRPTISQILQHKQLVEAKVNKNEFQGVLYDYAQQEDLPKESPHRNICYTPKHKLPLSQEY